MSSVLGDVSNLLGGSLGLVSGADYAQNKSNAAYQNALDQLGPGGTAAAQKYGAYESAALQPQFKAQDQQLAAKENAMGIGPSGAAKADYSDLATNQASVLAGAEAPLFSQGLGAYTGLLGDQAYGGNQAYQQALSQFQQAAATAAGAPPGSLSPQSVGAQPTPTGFSSPDLGYTYGGGSSTGQFANLPYSSPADYQAPANQNPYGPQS